MAKKIEPVAAPPQVTQDTQAAQPPEAPSTVKVVSDGAYSTDDLTAEYAMQYSAKDPLARMRKKVNDALTINARGTIARTGIVGLDLALHGGVTFGCVHELYGKSKAGKSYVGYRIALEAQRKHPSAFFVLLDRENAADPNRLISMGFDPARTLIIPARDIPEPDNAWDKMREVSSEIDRVYRQGGSVDDIVLDEPKTPTLSTADPTLKKEKKATNDYGRVYSEEGAPYIVYFIDSVPAFAEKADVVEDQGRRAKGWHAIMRRLTPFCDPRTMVLFSNHTTFKPTHYGDGKTKSSGTAPDFYRDCGIEVEEVAPILNTDGVQIGSMHRAIVQKTRRGHGSSKVEFAYYYKTGSVHFGGVMSYALHLGLGEVTNKTQVKEKKAPANIAIPSLKAPAISELAAPEDLQAHITKYGIIDAIRAKEAELFK